MMFTAQALENRLIAFGADTCQMLHGLPRNLVSAHLGRQLVRSATAAAANYAEACGAESPRDFVHKLQICLKELRETFVWLRFVRRLFGARTTTDKLVRECDELIAIFVKSILTAKATIRNK